MFLIQDASGYQYCMRLDRSITKGLRGSTSVQLIIKAVIEACILIDGCSIELYSGKASLASWHMPQKLLLVTV
jgi:hypothetical protein